ncbi:uncharacterized protein [Penaeus vannamei]|uniref:uncharacterized protein n=1 Tax=Penaeus vannamei TaxID=6689 RepID=UPI00387F8C2B
MRPGVLYGLPKFHKPNIPLGPIISSIDTFNYNAAKFLVPVISPLTSNHYIIDNSTAFAKDITSLNYQNPVTMASFDMESLFTTELIVNNLDISHLDKFGLDKVHFRKLLELTAHHSVFSFDDCLFMQTDGVAMGSSLGPSYANAFLCHHEQDWLEQCPLEFKPLHYRRYIDDTCLLFKHSSHVNLFLDYLNSKHPSIKFTCEMQKDNELPFLDTMVTNNNAITIIAMASIKIPIAFAKRRKEETYRRVLIQTKGNPVEARSPRGAPRGPSRIPPQDGASGDQGRTLGGPLRSNVPPAG